MIEHIEIKNFTVFESLKTDLVSGVNLFIGANGTGKTHLLKLLYSFQSAGLKNDLFKDLSSKLYRVFLPTETLLKRLIRKGKGQKNKAFISVIRNGEKIDITLEDKITHGECKTQHLKPDKPVYIPVKEMLANAPGFRSLYNEREIHFEEVYADIIDKAFLPPLKNITPEREIILTLLQKEMGGKIKIKNEEFYLKSKTGEIEFPLVAEGIRKLALLWLLIANGSLDTGATLYWDEPETNLNPSMLPLVVKVLLALERIGVQIFIASHSYVLMKEFELQRKDHSLCFYSLYKDENDSVAFNKSQTCHNLLPNKIADAYSRIYDLEIEQAMGVK
ncbi:MAG: AAA family ATPase [Desulfobacterales bacterium]|nr:AAA family ATPase [Desulfobacterales bacterium]